MEEQKQNKDYKVFKMASLFDGSGGFPLAGIINGFEPVWASEIEPFPIRVTTKRFPSMKHYGDVSKINGAEVEPVELITFGSPCQDLSLAGLRKGLEDGERSNLFYQAIRIIKEMRKATNGEYPKWAVWENVAGAFSSNSGADFRSVLQSFINIVGEENGTTNTIPQPKKWEHAGCVVADGISVAWRLVNAQFFGVPQRRRRIYLVASFTDGWGAEKVLFESEGLSRYFTTGRGQAQGTPLYSEESLGGTGTGNGNGGRDRRVTAPSYGVKIGTMLRLNGKLSEEQSPRLDASDEKIGDNQTSVLYVENRDVNVPYIDGWGGNMEKVFTDNIMNTLRVAQPQVVFDETAEDNAIGLENHPADSRVTISKDNQAQTLTSRMGTGGGNVPMVMEKVVHCVDMGGGKSSVDVLENMSPTLTTTHYGAPVVGMNENPEIYQDKTVALEGNGSRPSHKGDGYAESDVSYTLNTIEVHGVAYGIGRDAFNMGANAKFGMSIDEEVQPCMTAKGAGAVAANNSTNQDVKYVVRRLTPVECARLQGFPDWWCKGLETEDPTDEEIAFWKDVWKVWNDINGVKEKTEANLKKWITDPYSDAAEYKLWGNGIALPCADFVLAGIRWVEEGENGATNGANDGRCTKKDQKDS